MTYNKALHGDVLARCACSAARELGRWATRAMFRIAAMVIAGALANMCYAQCPNAPIPESSLNLVAKDPLIEAKKSSQTAAPKFWAVAGDGFYVPNTPGSGFCWAEAGLTNRLEGTTDVICSEDERIFQDKAWAFAKSFNERLLQLIPDLKKHHCASTKPDYQ